MGSKVMSYDIFSVLKSKGQGLLQTFEIFWKMSEQKDKKTERQNTKIQKHKKTKTQKHKKYKKTKGQKDNKTTRQKRQRSHFIPNLCESM